jgi:hypothetical protein
MGHLASALTPAPSVAIIAVGMSEVQASKAAANKPPAAPAPASLMDKLGPALAILICGGGFLSTGYLTHDANMMILGGGFGVAGVGVAIWRFMGK